MTRARNLEGFRVLCKRLRRTMRLRFERRYQDGVTRLRYVGLAAGCTTSGERQPRMRPGGSPAAFVGNGE